MASGKPLARIVSATPGRVRVRDRALCQPSLLRELETTLLAGAGISSCNANAAAGSLVIFFDPAELSVEALEARIDKTLELLLAKSPVKDKSRRRQINRVAKFGMLTSLTGSLALLAAGQKRGHALAGTLFIGCLGIHLATHRRALLR